MAAWIKDDWEAIPTSQVVISSKPCGIVVAADGSEDREIKYFKLGHSYHSAIEMLQSMDNSKQFSGGCDIFDLLWHAVSTVTFLTFAFLVNRTEEDW